MFRKSILIFCLAFVSLCAMADKTPKGTPPVKKVAILEIVDKTGQVSYAHKLMLRTNLTKAITEAEGYEGFDRTDLDALLGEQTFQRTGMVTNEQIKRVGELTGAQYILVAEAVMVDSLTIFASSKIIDVETAQTIKAESQLMRATPQDIQIGCTTLAGNMLGITLKAGITQAATSPDAPKPASTSSTTTTTQPPASKPIEKPIVKWTGLVEMSCQFKKAYRIGSNCFVVVIMTNKESRDLTGYTLLNKNSVVYDSEGRGYQDKSYYGNTEVFRGSTFGGQRDRNNCLLPSDVPVEFKLMIPNFNEEAKSIKLMNICFEIGEINGYPNKSHLEIKNIPIE